MNDDIITLAHGAGGRMSRSLMNEIIIPAIGNRILNEMHDGALLTMGGKIAFTTDSYVINPLFFPGGSVGRIAVCGTVNDLAMTGAAAYYISLALIIEEGFSITTLKKILADIHDAAEEAGVLIVTGDTKVVEHGKCDGIFINTSGVGEIIPGSNISPKNIHPGMDVILSGFIGAHAATILSARHGLDVPPALRSDAAPLADIVKVMLKAAPGIAVMRDPTRGGVAATLNELAESSGTGIVIEEELLPISPEVNGVCEILGFDPLELANEGKLIAIVPPEETEKLLCAMRAHPAGKNACKIGETTREHQNTVVMKTEIGAMRIVDMPLGNLVPRIC